MHSPLIKKALAILFLALIVVIKFNFSAQAQHSSPGMNADGNLLGGSGSGGSGGGYMPGEGWAVAVNAGYETPLGKLKQIYNAAPTFGLTVMKRLNHFILAGTVDYRSYQPKQRTTPLILPYMGQPINVGEITLTNFQGLGLYLSASYEMLITPGASFYAGVNLGSMRSSYGYSATSSQYFEIPDMPSGNIGYVGPKLGLNFALGNKIILGAEARYSFSVSGMAVDSFDGSASTEAFKSAAGNLFLAYSF